MRVISGIARGLKLNTPEDYDIRPTTDRVKESMFNIVAAHVYDAEVLDLFSGSGALGIEAISRGAAHVYFCDKDPKSIKVTNSNIKKTRFETKSTVINEDYSKAIRKVSISGKKMDLIFLDPPYYEGLFKNVMDEIVENSILDEDGILVVEHDYNHKLEDIEGLKIVKERKYGKTSLAFYSLEVHNE